MINLAMTSSFSNMYLATYLCFHLDQLEEATEEFTHIITQAQVFLDQGYTLAEKIVNDFDFNRIVYLGANTLKGIAGISS